MEPTIVQNDQANRSGPGPTTHSRTKESRHGIGPSHLLENGYEKTNLNLCGMLEKTVESGCALCFRQNLEPLIEHMSDGTCGTELEQALALFNGTQLFFEVDIKRGGSHLFL